jgi:competence protein ComEC
VKRPLGVVALLYGGGLLIAEFVQPPLPVLFAFSLALAAGALLLHSFRRFLIWPLIVFTGWTNLVWHTAIVSPHDLRTSQGEAAALVAIRGTLSETPSRRMVVRDEKESWHTLARVQVTGLRTGTNWQPAFGQVAVVTPGIPPSDFFAGQTVEIYGVLAPPPLPLAEGLFDYRAYLRQQGIYYQLKAESTNDWRIVTPAGTVPPLSDRFVKWAHGALARGLPEEDESLRLEWALTLGDKAVLTDDVSEPFIRAATYHIFAVDGLRMAIIFGIFFTLFRVARLPRAACGLLLIPVIWFYTALTGWPASAIRATVMLTIIIAGWALKRPSDLINSLFAAALIILVWEPRQLFQAGFQLSFFVVLCIVIMLPVFDRFTRRLLEPDPLLPAELRPRWQQLLREAARFVLDLLFASFAAWIGSIPLVAYYFHIVSPISAPANLVAVPLCALVLAGNLISLLIAGWFPGGAAIFNHAGWFLMECIRVTSHWFASWPDAYFYASAPGLFTSGLYYLILVAVFTGWLFKTRWRAWKIAGLVLLSCLWCVQWLHERSAARLTVLPLNGGSAVFFDAPGGKDDLLIDCGNTNSVEYVMKPFLRAQGVNHLPCLALTHGVLRSVGGVGLLRALVPVGQIATSSARFRSPTYRRIIGDLQRTPARWREVNRGDQIGNWTVLHPDRDDHFPQADDNALVLRGEFEGTRILLLSDLGRPGQAALLDRGADLRADIVVSGLPDQTEALSDGLIDAIHPRLIIIADSEYPAAKRAGATLQTRLGQRGIPVIYTRDAGAVKITLRRDRWEVSKRPQDH